MPNSIEPSPERIEACLRFCRHVSMENLERLHRDTDTPNEPLVGLVRESQLLHTLFQHEVTISTDGGDITFESLDDAIAWFVNQ